MFPSDCINKRGRFPNHRLIVKMWGSADALAMWSLDLESVTAEFMQKSQGHPWPSHSIPLYTASISAGSFQVGFFCDFPAGSATSNVAGVPVDCHWTVGASRLPSGLPVSSPVKSG